MIFKKLKIFFNRQSFFIQKISMKNNIINDPYSDYHIHSMFSDGCATIEEIVQFAWKIWMKEIAITDHSDKAIESEIKHAWIRPSWWARFAIINWRENIWNDTKVIFWVECDVLNENWDVCFEIQKKVHDFNILSIHHHIYESSNESAEKWLLTAIERYHDKISCIWHPYKQWFAEYMDMAPIVDLCNNYDIPIEFNRSTFDRKNYVEDKLIYVLKNTKRIYVNSDAHNLARIKQLRKSCYDFLETL